MNDVKVKRRQRNNTHHIIVEDGKIYINGLFTHYYSTNQKVRDAIDPHIIDGKARGMLETKSDGTLIFMPENRP
jgi:hypothetical protein